jgi:hypothetical protein
MNFKRQVVVIRMYWAELNLERRRERNGKDCEEEGEAVPQACEARCFEADCRQAFRQRPPQGNQARSSGCSQGQGSPQGRLNLQQTFQVSAGAALQRPAELFSEKSEPADSQPGRCVRARR